MVENRFRSQFGLVDTVICGDRIGKLTIGKAAARQSETQSNKELLREIHQALSRYFRGEPEDFARFRVDLTGVPAFQRKVLLACRKIPRGATVSYAELARRVGSPRAARAVGQAMARNPIPIIIPCHRVIASDGSLGGYGGGLEMKRALLRLEKAIRQDTA